MTSPGGGRRGFQFLSWFKTVSNLPLHIQKYAIQKYLPSICPQLQPCVYSINKSADGQPIEAIYIYMRAIKPVTKPRTDEWRCVSIWDILLGPNPLR